MTDTSALPPAREPVVPRGQTDRTVPPGVRAASEWSWRLLVIAAAVIALGKLLAGFGEILVPVLVSLLLAALWAPVVALLGRRGVPRGLGALVAVLLTIGIVLGLFALVGTQAANGFGDLRDEAVAGVNDLQQRLADSPLHLSGTALSDAVDKAETAASDNRSALLTGALGVASTATKVAEGLFIALFSTFFFLSSGSRIWAWLLRMCPRARRPRWTAPAGPAGSRSATTCGPRSSWPWSTGSASASARPCWACRSPSRWGCWCSWAPSCR